MALRLPEDFTPAAPERARPSDSELRELWERQETARAERERSAEWRAAREGLRRLPGGELRPTPTADDLPAYVRDRLAFGPDARAALRPEPRQGNVIAAGIDTWSPCWYAEPGSPLARAMRALASRASGRAFLVPEPLGGHRLGWFPDPGLVFAEGRPGGEALTPAAAIAAALQDLGGAIADRGIPLPRVGCAASTSPRTSGPTPPSRA
jgi:hypothetical protein